MFHKKSNLITLGIILSLLLMLSGCGGGTNSTGATDSNSKEPIKLGFMGALTGNVAIYGTQQLKGMKLAVDELNQQGGLLGRQVQIVQDDNAGQKDQAINIVNKQIDQDHVTAIFGDCTTGITKVVAPIANSKHTVIIGMSTGAGVAEIGPYVFRNSLLDSTAAPTLIKWAVEDKGWKNFAVITSKNNDYSVGLSKLYKDAIEKEGAKVVTEQFIQDGDTDFSAQVTNIKAANPDVIAFSGYHTEGALIMKKVRELGMKQILIAGDGIQDNDFIKIGGAAVEGTVSYAGFSSDDPSPELAKFIDTYKAKYNEPPDFIASQAYDEVMMVAKAIKDANSADPAKFKDTLMKFKDYPGVSGSVTYKTNGDAIKSPLNLLTVKNGKFTLLTKIPVN